MSTEQRGIYVLYVGAGREEATKSLIEHVASHDAYEEVFYPTFEKRIRRSGIWHTVDAYLVPGYLFVVATDVGFLREELKSVPALTKLLSMGEQFVPLGPEDAEWLEQLTTPFERTVGFSEGYIEGDRVVITVGPLRGQESKIRKIDRRKRLAYLDFHIMGREKTVKVGLEIVRKVAAGTGHGEQ